MTTRSVCICDGCGKEKPEEPHLYVRSDDPGLFRGWWHLSETTNSGADYAWDFCSLACIASWLKKADTHVDA